MAQLLNRQQVAKLLMLSPRRVNQLAKQGIIPKEAEGRYDLIGSVQGYISYLKENSINEIQGVITIAESKQRKLAAEAKMAELQYDLESGKVVSLEYVRPQWESLVMAMKTKLLAIPNKLTPLLVSQDNFNYVNQLLHEHIAEALNELAKGDTVELVGPSRDGDGDERPPEGTAAT